MADVSNYILSDDLKQAISISQSLAKENKNEKISPAHMLKALLHKDIGLRAFLLSLDQDLFYLEDWAEVRIESCPKTGNVSESPPADDLLQSVFREADTLRIKLSRDQIDGYCVLASISTPGVGFNFEQLKTFTLDQNQILDKLLEKSDLQETLGISDPQKSKSDKKPSHNALLKFCIDKNELAIQGKLDPVIGRDSEIRAISEILGRRSKSNVLILGDAGVGKTSLVNGFTQVIIENKIPESLMDAIIFELDYGALIAGASYKGEIEDRLKNIIKEIQQFEKAILFVDEMHMLLDQHGGTSGCVNLLKPELSRGNITMIGTTSIDNYTKYIEPDEAFNRQFELIKIDEPDDQTTFMMLKKIIPALEAHHNIKASDEVNKEAIRLSKRYLKERSLPDSAIDLIDYTMSGIRLMIDISPQKIQELNIELEQYKPAKNNPYNSELDWFYSNLKNQISPILFSKLDDKKSIVKFKSDIEKFKYCKKILTDLEKLANSKIESLNKSDIGSIVAAKTGIPLGKLQSKERDKLLNTEDYIKKRVVGQDHAIQSIAAAILESRSGLNKAGQPIGSFFFLGPTGTGKTELAKSLAEFLFEDESYLIRFDMSEFKEEHSAALLYGAPPGYVGYEEGGLLVNKIRQRPYSVVLFDEIEKAHSSVFDIFLQILDEGKLHDRLGKEGDFSNAVILFTSNIGSDFIVKSFNEGNIPKSSELMEIMSNYFRPEFLGRLTEIIPFAPISEENVIKIFEIHLRSLYKSLDEKGIRLVLDQKAKEKLALSGFSSKYGARPIIGVIRNKIRRPLSKMIIANTIQNGSTVEITIDQKGEIIWNVRNK